jgi:FlaA1/EpsC-like NDP-sugar epimerase
MSAEATRSPRPASLSTDALWTRIARRSVRGRADAALVVLDLALVALAYLILLAVRYDLGVPADAWDGLRGFIPLAMAVHLAANLLAGLYGPVWAQASIREAQRVMAAGVGATAVLALTVLFFDRLVPLSVSIVGGGIAMGLFGLLRFQSRLFAFHRRAHSGDDRMVIVGAGASAGSLLRELDRAEGAGVVPVALVDDDPRKLGRRLFGVPILGTVDDLVQVGGELEVQQLLLAIPSADSTLVQRVADAAAELGAQLRVLPGVNDLVNGHPQWRDVRDLSIDDLLGRQQVRTDLHAVEALVRGRCVLVTGAGGSIGSEIARQVAAYGPARLLLLDRDETLLFDSANAIGPACTQILADIRSTVGIREIFDRQRPEVVFHAAANKHVPLLESHPCQAVATNVLGTQNVIDAARAIDVKHLVFISTDKAVRPASVMGASKRVGEQLILTGAPEGSAWCAVRFGNVLGSRGSVVPTFIRQIKDGGPVTLTHPDMTRFFMSIPEAVQLVLQAAALAEDREVFMLDMGDPVRISDLANRMITLAGLRPGVDVPIQITGLRPGEKLSEELSTPEEDPQATSHPKILRLRPPLLPAEVLYESRLRLTYEVDGGHDDGARDLLFELARREVGTAPRADLEAIDFRAEGAQG